MREEESVTKRHPSFGKITVSKLRGGGQNLFMSDMTHSESVHIQIHEARAVRYLSRETVFEGKKVLGFNMTAAQWANFISSFSSGTGTPVTFHYKDGASVEACPPPEALLQPFDNDIKERTARATERARNAEALLAGLLQPGKTPTKAQIKDALTEVRMAIQDMQSNLPFVADSFKEKMENHVAKAQVEVESYINSRVHDLGVQALAAAPRLAIPMQFDAALGTSWEKPVPLHTVNFGEIEEKLAAAGELDEFIVVDSIPQEDNSGQSNG